MESTEVYRLLTRQIRRGLIVFPTLGLVSCAFGGVVLNTATLRPWALAALLAGINLFLGWNHVRKRAVAARKVSQNPRIVYWSHPNTRIRPLSYEAIEECTLITVHLRDATQLEVGLPPAQMRSFVAWLKEQNPTIRWGVYDSNDPTTTSER